MTLGMTSAERKAAEQAAEQEWIDKQLAKPGGHGPLTAEQIAVLGSVLGNQPDQPDRPN